MSEAVGVVFMSNRYREYDSRYSFNARSLVCQSPATFMAGSFSCGRESVKVHASAARSTCALAHPPSKCCANPRSKGRS